MIRPVLSAVLIVLLLAVAACSTDTASDDAEGDTADQEATEDVSDDTADEESTEPTTSTDESGDESSSGEADDGEAAGSEESEESSATPQDAGDESDSGGATTVSHALGETEVPENPERIVALEWTYAEDLLALGVQPAGVADVEGYEAWVNIDAELDESVTDVGTRQEPSLESIAELEPDLIIGVQFRHEPIYDQLESIAPTLLFNPYPEDESFSQFDEMEQTLTRIAEAVGREEEGEQVLEEMHATFEEAESDIEAAGVDPKFVLAQAFTSDSSPQMRLFIDTSMAVEILESIGLENAWDGEFDSYGFNTVGIEALATVQDASFLYVAQDDDNPFQDQWADNPVWNDLTFVQEDRVYPLGGDTWLFGGPLSAEVLAEQVRDIYLEAE